MADSALIDIFLGKGGVGKTTLSCAKALMSSAGKTRTLLVSFDPAHNLGDVFQKEIGSETVLGDFLSVREFDIDGKTNDYLSRMGRLLETLYAHHKAFLIDRYLRVLRLSPGAAEYAVFLGFLEILKDSRGFGRIVVDMPPTALSLRFLALPVINGIWCDSLASLRQEIIRKREAVRAVKEGPLASHPADPVMEKLEDVRTNLRFLSDLFRDGKRCRIHVVCTDEKLSLSETARIFSALRDLEITVFRLVVNKVSMDADPDRSLALFEEIRSYLSAGGERLFLPFRDDAEDIHSFSRDLGGKGVSGF